MKIIWTNVQHTHALVPWQETGSLEWNLCVWRKFSRPWCTPLVKTRRAWVILIVSIGVLREYDLVVIAMICCRRNDFLVKSTIWFKSLYGPYLLWGLGTNRMLSYRTLAQCSWNNLSIFTWQKVPMAVQWSH